MVVTALRVNPPGGCTQPNKVEFASSGIAREVISPDASFYVPAIKNPALRAAPVFVFSILPGTTEGDCVSDY